MKTIDRRIRRLEAELMPRNDERGITIILTSPDKPDEIRELRFTPPSGRRRLRFSKNTQ
jgi:hypothetical protein